MHSIVHDEIPYREIQSSIKEAILEDDIEKLHQGLAVKGMPYPDRRHCEGALPPKNPRKNKLKPSVAKKIISGADAQERFEQAHDAQNDN